MDYFENSPPAPVGASPSEPTVSQSPMNTVPKMTPLFFLLLGLMIGAGTVWGWYQFIKLPGLSAATEMAVKQTLEADKLSAASRLSGFVSVKGGNFFLLTQTRDDGSPAEFKVDITPETAIYHLAGDAASSREQLSFSDLSLLTFVTVVSDTPINNSSSFHAKEIITF